MHLAGRHYVKPHLLAVAAVGALICTPGCYSMQYGLRDHEPDGALMTGPKAGQKVVGHFSVKAPAWYILWGLVPISKPDVNAMLRKEVGDRKVANVRFKQEMDPIEGAISVGGPLAVGLTLAALNNPALSAVQLPAIAIWPYTYSVTVEGDIVE